MTPDEFADLFVYVCGVWNLDPDSSGGKARRGAWWMRFRGENESTVRKAVKACEELSPDRFPTVPQVSNLITTQRQATFREQRSQWVDPPMTIREWRENARELAMIAAENAGRNGGKHDPIGLIALKYAERYAENANRMERGERPLRFARMVEELTQAVS